MMHSRFDMSIGQQGGKLDAPRLVLVNGSNLCARACCSTSTVGVVDDAVMQDRLAYAIRAAMARRGIESARELARRMHRDPTTVNRWVTGKSVPSALAIRPLADALGVKVEYLVDPPVVPTYPVDDYLIPEEEAQGQAELVRRADAAARRDLEREAEGHRAAEDERAEKRRRRPA